jgi:hypothetical protein
MSIWFRQNYLNSNSYIQVYLEQVHEFLDVMSHYHEFSF